MLATISQLPEEQIATKRRCFVVKHTLSFDFSSLVAMAEEAHRLIGSVASVGGDSESEVK
jgi:hypothetical protein